MADNTNRIRKVNKLGIITTIAGTGINGYSGDGGDPLLAKLCTPAGITVDSKDNIYIGDECNNRVREITLDTPSSVSVVNNIPQTFTIAPNPSQGDITTQLLSSVTQDYTITITDLLGAALMQLHGITNKPTNISTNLPPGIYFITAIAPQQRFTQKLMII